MLTELYWIDGPWPGKLAISARARGGDWLEDEMRGWRRNGIDTVVSLLTPAEKRAWLDTLTGVTLASDAYIPFRDNVDRAHASGVEFVIQPGGAMRDQDIIAACDQHNMAMVFTGLRLFHH